MKNKKLAKKQLKTLWLYPEFTSSAGGIKFIFEVISQFNKKDFQFLLFTDRLNKKIIKKINKENIAIKTNFPLIINHFIYWFFLPLIIIYDVLYLFFFSKKVNVFIATMFPSNIIALFLGKVFQKPVLNYCYEPPPVLHNKKFINSQTLFQKICMKFLSAIFSSWDKYALQKSDYVFTLNQITKKMIFDVYKRKDVFITLMGVDSSHFHKIIDKKISKNYKNKIIIVHSTDYSDFKHTDLAIKTISHLVKKHPQLKLVITSTQPDHPNKNKLVKLTQDLGCENNVDFLGLVSYDDLVSYYSLALAYLSCSYDEMLGTTSSNLPVKEALACETPAIRANITTEDVEDGISGFLVDPRKTKQVAKKIEYLIKNPDLARKMGKVGRKKIIKLYNWKNVANIMKKVIEESVSK